MSSARSVVSWTVPKDVFDGLDCFAALASDLVGSVLREKALGVRANKGVACDDSV